MSPSKSEHPDGPSDHLCSGSPAQPTAPGPGRLAHIACRTPFQRAAFIFRRDAPREAPGRGRDLPGFGPCRRGCLTRSHLHSNGTGFVASARIATHRCQSAAATVRRAWNRLGSRSISSLVAPRRCRSMPPVLRASRAKGPAVVVAAGPSSWFRKKCPATRRGEFGRSVQPRKMVHSA